MKRTGSLILAALALLSPGAALAGEECRPQRYAAFDMTPTGGHAGFRIPVELDGRTQQMVVSLGHQTYIYDRYAEATGLHLHNIAHNANHFGFNGKKLTDFVRLPRIAIAGVVGTDIPALVIPAPDATPAEVAGVLGTDLLANFDVEVDMRARKLSLFKPDPCDGAGVYWSASFAALPMNKNRAGQETVSLKLDGHDISTMFDLDHRYSFMSRHLAERSFGVPYSHTSHVEWDDTDDPPGANGYRFAALEGGGLTINHPLVRLQGNSNDPICDSGHT
ncbi:MAG: retropepsin-like domain-containing protein, partial [Alphaproteobacteria bacterium]|nr:retropepsin-like domain-containing protein [Alphaproteobacteria bacterium]